MLPEARSLFGHLLALHKNCRRARERAEWEKLGLDLEAERERSKKDILPALQGVPLSRIIKATGLSRRYASMIRRGVYVLHPVHYKRLSGLKYALRKQ